MTIKAIREEVCVCVDVDMWMCVHCMLTCIICVHILLLFLVY